MLDSVEGRFVVLKCWTVIRNSDHVEAQNGLANLQGVFICDIPDAHVYLSKCMRHAVLT